MKKILVSIISLVCVVANAQDSSKASVTFSGYADVYYLYDLNKPADGTRPAFVYSYNRHNEFNLNLGFVKGAYSSQRIRANLALGAGTYMNANYSSEPGVLKNVFEANAGIRIGKKDLW